MPLTIQQGQLTQGLNISQAAAYAAIAAQTHTPDSAIGQSMARLIERLVEMALTDLVVVTELPETPASDTVQ